MAPTWAGPGLLPDVTNAAKLFLVEKNEKQQKAISSLETLVYLIWKKNVFETLCE